MGKKKVIQQTEEEALKEREELETKIQKISPLKATKKVNRGMVFITSTYNNTILTLADSEGNVLAWVSAGKIGFKGTKKGTPYAAAKAAEVLAETIEKIKLDEIAVKIKGIGTGRESALRTLATKGINISSIEDVTPIPHNGCKRRKPRRV